MRKIVLIIIVCIAGIAAITMYSKYRISSFEPQYIGYLTVENSTISKQLDTLLQKITIASIRGDKEFAEVLKEQVASTKELSLIAIADNEYSVLIAAKKDKIINQKLFDAIITDISQKKLLPSSTFPVITRYYLNTKFYFFIYQSSPYIIISAYSYSLPNNLIIKLALENFLIVIVFIIIGTAVSIALTEKTKLQIQKEEKFENRELPVNPVEEFCQQYDLTSVTIAMQNKKGNLKTMYSFPDKKQKLSLELEIIDELLTGSYILRNRNKELIMYNSKTKLFFKLQKNQAFKGRLIKDIENYINNNSQKLLAYLHT